MTAQDQAPDPVEPALQALREVILAGEKYRVVSAEYFGVTGSESSAMRYLAARGDLGQTALANQLGLTTSATTSLVDRLEGSGYVRRRPHHGDRRRTIVALTGAGRAALHQSHTWFGRAFDGLAPAELDRVTAILEQLATNLRGGIDVIPVAPVE